MPHKVLLIEDDAALANLASLRLQDLDFDITHVEDGMQALEYLEENQPDLLLLDINIPMVDGWQVLEAARREYGNAVKVIVTTARKDQVSRAKGELGMVDRYLTKPFSGSELRENVLEVMGMLEEDDDTSTEEE